MSEGAAGRRSIWPQGTYGTIIQVGDLAALYRRVLRSLCRLMSTLSHNVWRPFCRLCTAKGGDGSPKDEAAEAVAPWLCGSVLRVAGATTVSNLPIRLLGDAVVVRPPVAGVTAAGSASARHL